MNYTCIIYRFCALSHEKIYFVGITAQLFGALSADHKTDTRRRFNGSAFLFMSQYFSNIVTTTKKKKYNIITIINKYTKREWG